MNIQILKYLAMNQVTVRYIRYWINCHILMSSALSVQPAQDHFTLSISDIIIESC